VLRAVLAVVLLPKLLAAVTMAAADHHQVVAAIVAEHLQLHHQVMTVAAVAPKNKVTQRVQHKV
jgi:hypothetical protein